MNGKQMTTTNANLFKDQYFEINLATAKILTKKNITTYSEYSILIDDNHAALFKKHKSKKISKKLTPFQAKKLLLLVRKLKPVLRTSTDDTVEYDLHVTSKVGNFENINLRHRWDTRPQVMRDLFERTSWFKEPHQRLSSYIESL